MTANNEAFRAAFAAGAEWMRDVVHILRDGDIAAEAARRYPQHACPVCGRTDVGTTKAGVVRRHSGDTWRAGRRQVCFGAGSAPSTPKDVTP